MSKPTEQSPAADNLLASGCDGLLLSSDAVDEAGLVASYDEKGGLLITAPVAGSKPKQTAPPATPRQPARVPRR